MSQIKKYSLALLMVFCLAKAPAQDGSGNSFSLQQAVEYALKHNLSHQSAQLDLESAIYRKREITGIGLPQVSGSADIKDYLSIPTSLIPGDFVGAPPGTYIPVKFGTKYNATVGLSASQLIFNSDYIFGVKASKEFLNLSKIGIAQSKSEVSAQVAKAYYFAVISRERLKVIEANVDRFKKMYEDAKATNAQGFIEQIDVERLEVAYNNLQNERDKMIRALEIFESVLKMHMGMPIQEKIILSDSLRSADQFAESLGEQADLSQRPTIQLLRAQKELNELDVKRYKYGYLPTLAAYGAYQYNAQRNEFNFLSFDKNDPLRQWFKIALIGATLNLNIFDGMQRHNKIQQAKVASLKTANTLSNLELLAQFEITSASITYQNAYRSLAIQKRNMELAQHVFDVAEKKYQAGVGSNIEVVNAQTALIEAQTNFFSTVYDAAVAKIDYQKATGALAK